MLKAGFARVDITPPLGTYMNGYFEARYSKGILDPLYLNALAYTDGEKTNVLITCDACSITANHAQAIRRLIAEETGIPEAGIYIHSLHSHTAFGLNNIPGKTPSKLYYDHLLRKFADAAKMALDDLDDAAAYTARRETPEQISFIRRYRMKDGSVKTNPGFLNPDVKEPLGQADNTVRLVRFKRKSSPDIALVNFPTHPDTVGGEKYSADWPGFVRRYVEEDIGDVRCLVLNGCQGDVNTIDVRLPGAMKDVSGYYDYRACRRIGRIIADTVRDIWETGEKHKDGKVFSAFKSVSVAVNREGIDKYDEAVALINDHIENGTPVTMEAYGNARRITRVRDMSDRFDIPVSAQGFSDIVFVGFGGEPFSEYASDMRRAFPGSFVVTTCLTNGGEGYLPTSKAFAEGGYEAAISKFTASLQGDLSDAAKEMLDNNEIK